MAAAAAAAPLAAGYETIQGLREESLQLEAETKLLENAAGRIRAEIIETVSAYTELSAGCGGVTGLCNGHTNDSVCQGLRPQTKSGRTKWSDASDGALSVESLSEASIICQVTERTSTSYID